MNPLVLSCWQDTLLYDITWSSKNQDIEVHFYKINISKPSLEYKQLKGLESSKKLVK